MWDRDGRQPGVPDSPGKRRLLALLPFTPFAAATALTAACSEPGPPPQIAPLNDQAAQGILSKAARSKIAVVAISSGLDRPLEQGEVFVEAGMDRDPLKGRVVIPVGDASFTNEDKLQVTIVSDGRVILPNLGAKLGEARKFLPASREDRQPCLQVVFGAKFPSTPAELVFRNGLAIFLKREGSPDIAEYFLKPP